MNNLRFKISEMIADISPLDNLEKLDQSFVKNWITSVGLMQWSQVGFLSEGFFLSRPLCSRTQRNRRREGV